MGCVCDRTRLPSAIVKIVKKHDKNVAERPLKKKIMAEVKQSSWLTTKVCHYVCVYMCVFCVLGRPHPQYLLMTLQELKEVTALILQLFADNFCRGNLNVARTELLVKQNVDTNWHDFELGLR